MTLARTKSTGHSQCVACRRYASKVAALRQTFSEYGLIRFRVLAECRWLQQLANIPEVTEVPALSQEASFVLTGLALKFSPEDAQAVKQVLPISVSMQALCQSSHSLVF